MKTLVIGGVSYNIGWSENDFNAAYKAQLDGLDNSIATAKSEAIAAGALTIAESAGTGDILKSYTFTQNGANVGTINLAKDLVVSGGEIVEVEGVKYLRLTIANQESPVDIAVTDLVDVYGGSVYIEVGTDNTISVKFNDLDAALVAETAQVGAAIKAVDTKADGIRTDLGQNSDVKDADGSAFARIAQLVSDLEALAGEGGSVAEQISAAINTLKGSSFSYADLSALEAALKAVQDDYLKAADKTELQGNIDKKVDQTVYDAYVAANDAAVQANTEKLAGITAGANKVSTAYDEASSTLTITIE